MPDFYDRLENRTPSARESTLFRDLRHVLTVSKPRAPSLRAQLRGIDVAALTGRAGLAQVPVIRRADLLKMQADSPPFGGNGAMRLGGLKQIFLGLSRVATLEGQARDWWGVGRALFAAGLRKGTYVLNCLPYDLVPDGHMVASGAASIGCPVIPAGAADVDLKVDAIAKLKPGFFCGHTDEFRMILNHAADRNVDTTGITTALLTGFSDKGRRSEYGLRGFDVRHVYMLPELGVVGFESGTSDGMTVAEGLIVEIIDPLSGREVETGEPGELVVTRINPDCPILRYATGAIASVCKQPSNCGRTNMRITLPHDRTPNLVETSGRRIHISDLEKIAKRHPTVARVSLVMRRNQGLDHVHLRVEHRDAETLFVERLTETLHLVTNMHGTVEVLAPGTMSDDDAMIVDERNLH